MRTEVYLAFDPFSRRRMGGELSKREGVLFHWWPFSSKRNDRLRPFYPEKKTKMNFKTKINLLGVSLKWRFIKFMCV